VREIVNIVQWRCDIDVLGAEQIPLPIVKVDGCVVAMLYSEQTPLTN
jgi:hypothetical protein